MAGRNGNGSGDGDDGQAMVFENLGLDADDLGIDTGVGDDGGGDLGDEGQDDGDAEASHGIERQQDRLEERRTREDRQPERRQQQPDRVSHTRPDDTPGAVRADGKGNLVDQSGKVVARAGAEARFYTAAYQARREAQQLRESHTDTQKRLNRALQIAEDLNRQVTESRGRDAAIERFGLKPNQQLEALQLYNDLKGDMAGTLKKLLTRAAANGIDIAKEFGQNGGIDVRSIVEAVRTELNPLRQQQQADAERRRQEEENLRAVERERVNIETFFTENPDARQYLHVFDRLAKNPQFNHMSLGEMWARIQLNLLRGGQQSGDREQAPGSRDTRRRRSLPSGRGEPAGDGRTNGMAPINTDYSEILNDVLDETGYRRAV